MSRRLLGTDVFDASIARMIAIYKQGHRVVVSFSAGKDSCCVLEVCLIAARETGRLPVEVVIQDEEIAFPGTYEYAERVAARDEIDFTWLIMGHPMLNVFDRKNPYFWTFDDRLKPEEWVRTYPSWASVVPENEITMMTVPWRFPPPEGKKLYATTGLRVSESHARMFGLFQSGGYVTRPNKWGVLHARPIYDWSDGDVWRAIHHNGWDYNTAYNLMLANGIPKRLLRVAPPTMHVNGIKALKAAAASWPKWFDKVCKRLAGVRTAAQFGLRSVQPKRRLKESWEDCYQRECIDTAPKWIADRAITAREKVLKRHGRHSTAPLPEVKPCYTCTGRLGSWKKLANTLYYGDPFATKTNGIVPWVEPDFFREGSGKWIVEAEEAQAWKAAEKAKRKG